MERLAFSCGLPAAAVDDRRTDEPDASVAAGDAHVERQDSAAFRALLAFTFVLFVRPQDTFPFLEPLHLADLTAALAAFSLIAGRLGRGAPLSRITPELLAVLSLGGVMLATAPFSLWPGGAVAVFTDLFVKVILVFVLMVNTITTRDRFERLVNIVVLGTSYVAVRAVIDYGRGANIVEGGRVQGTGGLFGNPNDMALNMIAFLPLAVMLALGQSRRALRFVALIGIPAISLAVIFSKSRGGTGGTHCHAVRSGVPNRPTPPGRGGAGRGVHVCDDSDAPCLVHQPHVEHLQRGRRSNGIARSAEDVAA